MTNRPPFKIVSEDVVAKPDKKILKSREKQVLVNIQVKTDNHLENFRHSIDKDHP